MRLAFVLASLVVGAGACSPFHGAEEVAPSPDGDAGADGRDDDAIHVAPDGRDFAEGTKRAPVATLTRALALATERGGADIYVCVAKYAQNVVIDRPARIFGDRSCTDWSAGAGRARFETLAGIGVRIADTQDVLLEDVIVSASADHTRPGSSAIAMFVTRSVDVTLRRVELRAGKGGDGPNGGAATDDDETTAKNGANASFATPGSGASCTCTSGDATRGGDGADGATPATSGTSTPAVGAANAGISGPTCTPGLIGANGAGGAAAAPVTEPLVVTANAIEGTRGGDGGQGHVGQGGGGGGHLESSSGAGGGGGGGGCGGCGGAGGRGGASGGSSIALVSFESSIAIEDSALVAANGGRGGNGGTGGKSHGGGLGGMGSDASCNGAAGGDGGSGAGGGGGAGGHSIGIAYVGAPATIERGTMTIGSAGPPGTGGAPGPAIGDNPGDAGERGPDGANGKTSEATAL